MSRIRRLIVLLTLAAAAAACGGGGPADHNVLFVGNSHTHGNDVPGMVEAIAAANGVSIDWEMIAPGGAHLDQHLESSAVRDALRSGEFDTVVFQEQSTVTAVASWAADRTIPAALTLDGIADAAGVRVIWFETWGHLNGNDLTGHPNFTSMQASVSATYADIAERTGGTLAPVGQRWEETLGRIVGVSLYASDGYHSSPAGAYVAAIELAAAIMGEPVLEAPSVGSVDSDTATALLG